MIETNPVATIAANPQNTAASASQASALTSDFDAFLQMLTAQAKYQDPLEPIDSTEYAAQLAQFSMVEQQVQTNDMLAALYGQLGQGNISSLASWVGMEVRAVTPAYFDGSPITVSPNPAPTSDQVFLVVQDETGQEMQRLSVPVSADSIEWPGLGDHGQPFATGAYQFTIESYRDSKLILSEPAQVYGRVTEAQTQDGQVILILEGGQAIRSSSVTALRGGS